MKLDELQNRVTYLAFFLETNPSLKERYKNTWKRLQDSAKDESIRIDSDEWREVNSDVVNLYIDLTQRLNRNSITGDLFNLHMIRDI